jgi:hypothetical protein
VVFVGFNYNAIFSLLSEHLIVIYGVIAFFYLYLLVIRKYPLVLINPASILLIRGTSRFKKIAAMKIGLQLFYCVAISIILHIISQSTLGIIPLLNVCLSLVLCSLLSWSRFNNKYSPPVYVLFAVIEISLLFINPIIGITVNILAVGLWIIKKPVILWEKYYEVMSEIYILNAASARSDFAQMQAISSDYSARKTHRISFPPTLLKWPLFAKSLSIDTLRMPYYHWVITIGVYVVAAVIFVLGLFYPLTTFLFVFGVAATYSYMIKIYSFQVRDLINKARKGLFVPCSLGEIAVNNAIVPAAILLLANVATCLFYGTSLIVCLIEMIFLILINVLSIFVSAKFISKARLVDGLSSIAVLVTVILCQNPFYGL